MKTAKRIRTACTTALLLILAACAASQGNGTAPSAAAPPLASTPTTTASSASASTSAPTPAPATTVMTTTPATDIAAAITTPAKKFQIAAIDQHCKTDADCAIKDVGSCCGYRPACVNIDSKTHPEQVKAQCAKSGQMGICGFPSISGCQCVSGQCAVRNGTGNNNPLGT
ncbi:MAG TPA: hypothetical protein VKM35_06365 [Arenimonas sp.]|uniref:hypothetical protein n=1 Tax=Arenimonas sp. TaxID=1872635 RepID=UPI002BA72C3C|nr:hypothetical protein [Arenimonas sp.]HMB56816.1 hypothetical protein [Arenimonas sp.]